MILSTLVTSQLHFEMCAGLYGHPVVLSNSIHLLSYSKMKIYLCKAIYSRVSEFLEASL